MSDLWFSKSEAAELLGHEQQFIHDQILPRLASDEKRKLPERGSPWSLSGPAVVRAFSEYLAELSTGDPEAYSTSGSPALERQRVARAKLLEWELAENEKQLVSVELFRRVMSEAFAEVRKFAERQIKEHGNGTAADWKMVVERFGRLIEGALRKSGDTNGKGTVPVAGDAPGATTSPVAN